MLEAGSLFVPYLVNGGILSKCRRLSGVQNLSVEFDVGASVIPATVDPPLESADDDDDGEYDDTVIHVAPSHWQHGRENEQNCSQNDVCDADEVGHPCEPRWKDEMSSWREHFSSSQEVDGDGNTI